MHRFFEQTLRQGLNFANCLAHLQPTKTIGFLASRTPGRDTDHDHFTEAEAEDVFCTHGMYANVGSGPAHRTWPIRFQPNRDYDTHEAFGHNRFAYRRAMPLQK
jgi:hypothetical protein